MTETSRDEDDRIVRRTFDVDETDPNVNVAQTVAELEGKDSGELTPLYECIGHVLEHIFSNPPSPTAQTEVSFTYEGYRITVHQDGTATFLKLRTKE